MIIRMVYTLIYLKYFKIYWVAGHFLIDMTYISPKGSIKFISQVIRYEKKNN